MKVLSAVLALLAAHAAPVGPGVRAAIARDGSARVVVALRARSGPRSLAAATSDARAVQARVLARTRGGFRPSARWATVPALAGRVGAAGLRRLRGDPEVRRIDLDDEGGRAGDVESLHLDRKSTR